jgi:hypothetical protein
VKQFFKDRKTGTYIMWTSTHVVMVVDGQVFESSKSASGCNQMDVEDWLEPYHTGAAR